LGVSGLWARDVEAKKAEIYNRSVNLKWLIIRRDYTRIVLRAAIPPH
jgi:hypothetical protein